jgi:hypothetical protein
MVIFYLKNFIFYYKKNSKKICEISVSDDEEGTNLYQFLNRELSKIPSEEFINQWFEL